MDNKCYKLCEDVVVRVESDDYAILFNPDTGDRFVLDPVAVFICSNLDGKSCLDDIVKAVYKEFEGVPDDAGEKINSFIMDLIDKSLV